ncbi:N-acetylglucosamine repressor [Sedimentisphaera cyanobacteriorum]|uniref:N-acetylglucosamine repressor n=1 Tax=Sedimentisphaera cyanobacteriorum TaxID=1940790 RepID=A0A1Q2HND8_9BACT|nr:ROK family transcriptional regulator [Sedimentisphaera cyanobacteriorum]AQQ08774.1 N-acetylglucosamine repressor [Sedimentisphaera cyanobacteriorum]
MSYYINMNLTAIDSKNAGLKNEKLVLNILRRQEPLSQAQLCQKTELGSSTVTYIVGRLRKKGLIQETQVESVKRGARPKLISINPSGGFVVGAEISPSHILLALYDLNSSLRDKVNLSLELDRSAENVVKLAEISIKGLLNKYEISSNMLGGIGLALSGSISPEGVVKLSGPLGWKNIPLKAMLEDYFECPIYVFTTKVRLLAELNASPSLTKKNIVYFNAADGVGVNTIVDGNLINGATNRCGEIGHIVIDPNGPLCGCGQRGCLEAHISGPAIADKVKKDLASGVQSGFSKIIIEDDQPEVVAGKWKKLIEEGDEYALSLRDYAAEKISWAAAAAINIFDPDVLILAGYINEVSFDYFKHHLLSRFETNVYDESSRNIEIRLAQAGHNALMKGASAAVLEEQFSI